MTLSCLLHVLFIEMSFGNCRKCLRDPKFQNFLGGMAPDPLSLERLWRSLHSLCAYTFKVSRDAPAVEEFIIEQESKNIKFK